MAYTIQAAGVTLPSPTKVTSSNEIIWSSDTGRNAAGAMMGTQVAKKRTYDVEWGVLSEAEVKQIQNATAEPYFSVTIGAVTMRAYRGNIQGEQIGPNNGVLYYRSLTVSFIEK